ncbi:MAG: SUMF1/EgtB/PvdO family nonheme iron enzyme, partial [Thermoguttaceae bacterium]
IASKIVTKAQFQHFQHYNPDVVRFDSEEYGLTDDCPQVGVGWYDAARYCNWLSESEGIPKEQWCYEPNAQGKYAEGMKPAADYLRRGGYRLPTEAEWEYACRSGTEASRYYGLSVKLLPKYSWFLDNSDNRVWPVGMKIPNDYGLFDMLGNVHQWCDNLYENYAVSDDPGSPSVVGDKARRVSRGGSFNLPASHVRSAYRPRDVPPSRYVSFGFRAARTYPELDDWLRADWAPQTKIKTLGGKFLANGCKSSWSPDGDRIVFGKSPAGQGLSILDLKTGKITDLADSGKDPAWSPGDGRIIAYVRGEGVLEEVWLVEASGGGPRRLVDGGYPTWSADGKTLFLHSPGLGRVESVLMDAKDPIIADAILASSRFSAVSPDGKRIAYQSDGDLVVANREPAEIVGRWVLPGGIDRLPAWSPDGKLVGFVSGPRDVPGLWILDIAAGHCVLAVPGPVSTPAWSRDGSKLTFDLQVAGGIEVWMTEAKALGRLKPVELPRAPDVASEGGSTSPIASKAKLTCLDLQPKANQKHDDYQLLEGNDLRELPRGEQTLAGVKFWIGNSAIQLGSKKLPNAPRKVEGIPVNRTVARLYVLHAVQYGRPEDGVPDETMIGQYDVRYEDGSALMIPIVQGQDVRDWWNSDGSKAVTRGRVAWTGSNEASKRSNQSLRLYLGAWDNPNPDKKVLSIDYISADTAAAPFCVAMTVEEPVEPKGDKPTPPPASRKP